MKVFFYFVRKNLLCIGLFFLLCDTVICIKLPLETSGGGASFGFVDINKILNEYDKVAELKLEYSKLSEDRNRELEAKKKEIENLEIEIKNLQNEIRDIRKEIENLESVNLAISTTQSIVVISTEIKNIQDNVSSQITSSYTVSEMITSTSVITDQGLMKRIYHQRQFNNQQVSTDTYNSNIENVSSSSANISDQIKAKQKSLIDAENNLAQKTAIFNAKNNEYENRKKEVDKELKEFDHNNTLKILGEIYKIIEEIAKEENISIIVDKSNILYGLSGIDLTDKVKERLQGK